MFQNSFSFTEPVLRFFLKKKRIFVPSVERRKNQNHSLLCFHRLLLRSKLAFFWNNILFWKRIICNVALQENTGSSIKWGKGFSEFHRSIISERQMADEPVARVYGVNKVADEFRFHVDIVHFLWICSEIKCALRYFSVSIHIHEFFIS